MGNLAGLLAAIAISAILLPVYFHVIKGGEDRQVMAAAGSQFQDLLSAAAKYADANLSQLTATVPVGGTIQVPLSSLIAANDLSPGFGSVNPFGQTWQVFFQQPQAGEIDEIVDSVGGMTLGLPTLTGVAAMASGQSGFVPPDGVLASLNSGTAVGNMGKWRAPLVGRPNPGPGHFYGFASYGAAAQYNSDVLYRDNVPNHPELTTMNADLNMGGNAISNARAVAAAGADPTTSWPAGWGRSGFTSGLDVYAGGAIGAGSNGQVAAYINSQGYGHVDNHFDARQLEAGAGDQYGSLTGGLKIGNAYLSGDSQNLGVRAYGSVYFQHPGDASSADIAQVGSIYAAGRIGTSGYDPNGGYPTGWGGGYHGFDGYFEGSVGAGVGGALASVMHSNGVARFEDSVQIGTASQAYPGNDCAPNGALAMRGDGSGIPLTCTYGKWSSIGSTFNNATWVSGILAMNAMNGPFTNNTANAAAVNVVCPQHMGDLQIRIWLNGINVWDSGAYVGSSYTSTQSADIIVPAGETYSVLLTGFNGTGGCYIAARW